MWDDGYWYWCWGLFLSTSCVPVLIVRTKVRSTVLWMGVCQFWFSSLLFAGECVGVQCLAYMTADMRIYPCLQGGMGKWMEMYLSAVWT
ncbi:hypothetical protein M440DRAFT_1089668 [Trichoderma longibrachiatum ATCC 18648]|uniref:Uncharacterized protein n=1 Tax=Trichoderma longibrachiatum ATCC 18648 TaxID=983965 RepID=A0A2T4BT35_TRILO|nr:hypothetical protein M440DRAFT_1089668 [Trichoderma longibrachiatum ATCC 18648]